MACQGINSNFQLSEIIVVYCDVGAPGNGGHADLTSVADTEQF